MNIRTEGEIKAYVDGYTKCYNDFTEYLKRDLVRRCDRLNYVPNADVLVKMNMLLTAVKAALPQEDNDNQVV